MHIECSAASTALVRVNESTLEFNVLNKWKELEHPLWVAGDLFPHLKIQILSCIWRWFISATEPRLSFSKFAANLWRNPD